MNFKSEFSIFLILLFMLMIASVSAGDNQTHSALDNSQPILEKNQDESLVGVNNSIKSFHQDLVDCNGTFNMNHDYVLDEEDKSYSTYGVSTLVINGNNHIFDGNNSEHNFIFRYGNEIGNKTYDDNRMHLTINDVTFKNFNAFSIEVRGNVTFNNVNITNCNFTTNSLLSIYTGSDVTLNNVNCNSGAVGDYDEWVDSFISVYYSKLSIVNSDFNCREGSLSAIGQSRGQLIIENSTFSNFNAPNGAIANFKGDYFSMRNSRFFNSSATFNGGAIIAKYFPLKDSEDYYIPSDAIIIENCIFSNLTSSNDGGAIYIDLDSGANHVPQILNVINSNFTDCTSSYGGAIAIQGGTLNIEDSSFINNSAAFEGGALFTTWSDVNIINTNLSNNTAEKNAGAVYFDKGKLTIKNSNFMSNKVIVKTANVTNCIYAHDVVANFSDSNFDNGGISVYADFASDSKLENITKNDDIFLMDNKDYIVSIESEGIKLNFTKNEITVNELPSKFDARDWGWITPVKLQGDNDDCWAFATVAALETSLYKATGQQFNLSENYVQRLQVKYSQYGDKRISLTGFAYSGLGYALSWIGALPSDSEYDERGLIADTDFDVARIHVQDAVMIQYGQNDTNELIKWAILKYGAVAVQYIFDEPDEELNSTGDDIAVMDHNIHFITLIGWDDTYVYNHSSVFKQGCWLTKDSLSSFKYQFYDTEGLMGVDYYAIVPQNYAVAYIFENDIDYHMNYQTDITGLTGFDGNYTYYSNEFTSKYSELIGAVGTYFNESGIDYSFDVYVNGNLVHTQYGVSEFAGFRTIILNKYIPVKAGDTFKVVFKNNAVPYQAFSRQHYIQGMTFVSDDGKTWNDITLENRTVCLKVYTVADDTKIINNNDIAVDYTGGKYFSVKVVTSDGRTVGEGAVVKFTINGKTYSISTDNNGIAKIKITQLPKKYTITTTYNGKTYKNTVTVKQVLTASKVTIKKKTAKKLTLKAKLKINGKLVKGKKITFKLKGKKYKVKTNKKGIAKKVLKRKVIKKLKKGKTYKVKVTYIKTTIKTKVKVK